MVAIGTPYKENSVTAIARRAAGRAQLEAFYTTIYTARFLQAAMRLPLRNQRCALIRELQRRAYPGVPANRIRTLATSWDLALFAFRRMHFNGLSSRYTFTVKHRFDYAMARAASNSPARAVLGMWGSCEETFRVAHRAGRFTVMNYVNSHPAEQNRLVSDLGGAPAGHHELVPAKVVAQVERETAEADLILAPSQFVARQLLKFGTPSNKIVVEPYGVDLRAFTPPAKRRGYLTGQRLQVLCVALITYRKGIRDLIAAARMLSKEADFHLVGPIVEAGLLEGLPANVSYHGVKVQSEIAAAMQCADVLVLASVEDAYPLVVAEAMATGLPVIVSDHVGSAETVVEGETGLIFPATDVSRLVSCVQLLHANPLLRERMGTAARSFVERSSSWDAYADRVLDLIAARTTQDRSARHGAAASVSGCS